jgi:hypothetical protein
VEQITCYACGEKMFTSETYCPKCRSPRLDSGAKQSSMTNLYVICVAIVITMIAVVMKAARVFG